MVMRIPDLAIPSEVPSTRFCCVKFPNARILVLWERESFIGSEAIENAANKTQVQAQAQVQAQVIMACLDYSQILISVLMK